MAECARKEEVTGQQDVLVEVSSPQTHILKKEEEERRDE